MIIIAKTIPFDQWCKTVNLDECRKQQLVKFCISSTSYNLYLLCFNTFINVRVTFKAELHVHVRVTGRGSQKDWQVYLNQLYNLILIKITQRSILSQSFSIYKKRYCQFTLACKVLQWCLIRLSWESRVTNYRNMQKSLESSHNILYRCEHSFRWVQVKVVSYLWRNVLIG